MLLDTLTSFFARMRDLGNYYLFSLNINEYIIISYKRAVYVRAAVVSIEDPLIGVYVDCRS